MRTHRIPAAPLSDLTQKDFKKFVEVQRSGATNMMDTEAVEMLSGLTIGKVKGIIAHYNALSKKFPKVG